MSEVQKSRRGCSWLQLVVGGLVVMLVIGALIPTFNPVARRANQAATVGNCRQILAALSLYAGDHDGKYPDVHESEPSTSNDAFRILIRQGVLEDERVFGARVSKYQPDNNVGNAPDFDEALKADENHWAMTKKVTEKSSPMMPLIVENPVTDGWPPGWNCDAVGKKEKGRAWRGGKIIVGFNDTSVQVIKLESDKGPNVAPARGSDSMDVFTRAASSMEILGIED